MKAEEELSIYLSPKIDRRWERVLKGMVGYRHSNLDTGVHFDLKTIERLVQSHITY